jgi:hypothetical protein
MIWYEISLTIQNPKYKTIYSIMKHIIYNNMWYAVSNRT